MINYSYVHISESIDDKCFYELLSTVPISISEQALQYRNPKDRYAYLLGKIIARNLLIDRGCSSDCLNQFYKNDYGKLFINDAIDFNISHSADIVIGAVSDTSDIGVDVELIQDFSIDDLAPFLRDDEVNYLNTTNSNSSLFDFWTQKESLIKATGRGFDIDLKNIYLSDNKGTLIEGSNTQIWNFQKIPIDNNYSTHLCFQGLSCPKIGLYKFER